MFQKLGEGVRGGLIMDKEKLLYTKAYLKEKGKMLPKYMEENMQHWSTRIYMGDMLYLLHKSKEAYELIKEVYEEKSFIFDKEMYSDYEEYLVEKVKFLMKLAALEVEVTGQVEKSIHYLDEAMALLDSAESVYPYVAPREIEHLKASYLKRLA